MKKMQNHLMFIVILATVVATFVSAFFSLMSYTSIGKDRSRELLSHGLTLSSNYVNTVCSNVERMVNALSYHYQSYMPPIEAYNTPEGKEFFEQAKAVAKAFVAYNDYVAAVYFRLNPNLTDSKAGFFMSKKVESGSSEVVDTEPTDIALYGSEDIEHVGWFYEPMKAGHAIWVVPYMNKNNGILTLSYVNPIYAKDGTFIGVVGVDIDKKIMHERIAAVKVYKTGFAALMTQSGIIQYAPYEIHITAEEKKQIVAQDTFSMTYIDKQRQMTVLAKKLKYGEYLLLIISNEDLYVNENRVILSIVIITFVVSFLIIFLLTGLLHRIFTRFRNDSLSKAENRSSYMDEIQEVDEAIRTKKNAAFSVLVFDINGLKRENDIFGHGAGDRLIKNAADVIRKYFPNQTFFRIGGDEFVLITRRNDKNALTYIYEKFKEEMEERIKKYDATKGCVDADGVMLAVGIAFYDKNKDRCYDDVFRRADQEMYANKAEFYKVNAFFDRRKK